MKIPSSDVYTFVEIYICVYARVLFPWIVIFHVSSRVLSSGIYVIWQNISYIYVFVHVCVCVLFFFTLPLAEY